MENSWLSGQRKKKYVILSGSSAFNFFFFFFNPTYVRYDIFLTIKKKEISVRVRPRRAIIFFYIYVERGKQRSNTAISPGFLGIPLEGHFLRRRGVATLLFMKKKDLLI